MVSSNYLSLSPDEAAFTEALVDLMCPADELTPCGTDCGLVVFIDRQLAGAFGKGERLYMSGPWRPGRPELGYQLPLTPEQFFKAGIAAADAACAEQHARRFAELSAAEADTFLGAVVRSEIDGGALRLSEWFHELCHPLFLQACFADPIYGGNRDKVFWRMLGYPGLPAVNGLNMVRYRGQPFPSGGGPKSIEDFG
jgi:gluconate 2-dehydrogenase gamma chain